MQMAIYGSLPLPWHAKVNLTNKTYNHQGNYSGVSNCFTLNVRGTDWSNNHYDQLVNKIWDFYNMNDVKAVADAAVTFPTHQLSSLMAYDNKVIQFSDGLYKCTVYKTNTENEMTEAVTPSTTTLIDSIYNGYNNWASLSRPDKSNFESYEVIGRIKNYRIRMEKLSQKTITITLPASKFITADSAYDMFAIPFDTTRIYDNDSVDFNSLGKDDIMGIVNALTTGLNDKELYDIQLLPYCPIPSAAKLWHQGLYAYDGVDVTMAGGNEHVAYEYIVDSDSTKVGVILFPTRSAFTTKIYHYMNAVEPTGETTIDFKIKDICNMYRLTGGNHANSFEFNPTRTGEITWFKVSATYIPFQPYIRVCPEFTNVFGGYLYGP